MNRYCHDDYEHRRQAEDDFRWRGRPDYEMQDRQHDDECARVYMEQYRREEERYEERRQEEAREERRAAERAAEARYYEEQMEQMYAQQQEWPEPPHPEEEPRHH